MNTFQEIVTETYERKITIPPPQVLGMKWIFKANQKNANKMVGLWDFG